MRIELVIVLVLAASAGPAAAQHGQTTAAARDRQIAEVRRATARYRDVHEAERDGYRLLRRATDAPLMGEHWVSRELLLQPIDLSRPAVLQYAKVNGERVLVGVAYGRFQRPGEALPEGFAGHDDHWHVHDLAPLAEALAGRGPVRRWLVQRAMSSGRATGDPARTQLAMVHAWVWSENPDGMFANFNRTLPYLRAGLPVGGARGVSGKNAWAAARGVALLAPESCTGVGRGAGRLLEADRAQRRTLETACRSAAARVRSAAGDPARLNSTAAAAFAEFAGIARRTLTPAQRARAAELARVIGEMPESGGHH